MPAAISPVEDVSFRFDSIEDTIASFRDGNFIIVLDDPSRENEGDLIIAASEVTPQKMAFMVRHTSGLICAPVPTALADRLALPPMVAPALSEDPHRTAYTVSIDANHPETTTGISAHNRALTCNLLAARDARPSDFRRPGHVFPLRAKAGGVRERRGHTEAATDFCLLAGKEPVAAISELVENGEEIAGRAERTEESMMRTEGCLDFGKRWGLKVCTIEALVEYMEKKEGKLMSNGTANRNA